MKVLFFFIISSILLFLLGCDKNQELVLPKGSIVGFVRLIDETGIDVEDKSGVQVSLEGLNKSATTNEDGRYELSNVPAGTYHVTFTKTGYGTTKKFSYQFVGGNIPALMYGATLYEQPNIEVQSLDISFKDNMISISGKMSETSQYSFQTFLNDSSNVSNLNYDFKSGRYSFCCFPSTQFSQNISLSNAPFSQGDKVYLVIYFLNPNEGWGYYDYENEMDVITSFKKATSVISLILD